MDFSFGSDIREGAFYLEEPELEDHFGIFLGIDRVLLKKKTPIQELVVAEAGPLGRVLILDGNIQVSEFDESGYHEMMAHLPLLTHPDPRRVLVVGGGDGGVLREVLRHPSVEKAELCEIDEEVVNASRRFFPGLACALEDPRAVVHFADGIDFVRAHPCSWDVILVDSSDPVGPAEGIFQNEFYSFLRDALKPGGIAVTQCESFFLYEGLIREIFGFLPEIFPVVGYYQTLVPTYSSGTIGFAFCSLGPNPLDTGPDPHRVKALGDLSYYTPLLHRASFALPRRFLLLLPETDRALVLNRALERI